MPDWNQLAQRLLALGKKAVKTSADMLQTACTVTGDAVAKNLSLVSDFVYREAAACRNGIRRRWQRLDMTAFLQKRWALFSDPFIKMAKAPKLIAASVKETGWTGGVKTFGKGLKNNFSFFRTIFNYAVPVIGIVVLVNVVTTGLDIHYVLAVEGADGVVAYVENEGVLASAKSDLHSRMISTEEENETLSIQTSYKVVPLSGETVASAAKVTDSLITMYNSEVVEAQGVYIDGEFYGAVDDITAVPKLLESILDRYRSGSEGESVDFVQNIELRQGLYPTASVIEENEMVALLTSTLAEQRIYTIEKGDSPIVIANKNGLSYAEFKKMNPTIEEECFIGQEAIIANEQPFLSVRTVKTEVYNENIAYDTEYTYDDTKYNTYSTTVQQGQEGVMEVTAEVVYLNGIEESRDVLQSEIITEPVTAKVIKGTKVDTTPYASYVPSSTGSGTVSGGFVWPVASGYISCYYGSGGHGGIDVATSYGTDIYAAASGTVVISGWYYSYGKCIVIDHGNGVRTLYGHCSSLYVSVGSTVSQGQVIAAVGSTGYSTGNHLHFEVQVNGSRRNPLNYVSR